jgi:hypothetical protein
MKKRLLCYAALLSVCISSNLFAQTTGLQQIIPPSPIMTPYLRYGDYPVSYATGMANISIPLYDIKVKDFTFPINISFHASGRRTNSEISTMGVGWLLNATGFISREIRNRPDEQFYNAGLEDSLADISQTNGQPDLLKEYNALLPADMTVQYLSSATFGFLRDSEHDVYSYDVNGMSGKFVMNNSGYAVPLTAVPYHFITNNTIIDEKGVKYEFGLTGNEMESTVITQQNSSYTATTGRYLSKITLPTGQVITFTYGSLYTGASQAYNIQTPYQEDDQLTYSNYSTSADYLGGPNMAAYSQNEVNVHTNNVTNSGRPYTIKYLTAIDFGNGKVTFNYDPNSLTLTDMEVTDAGGNQIKRADFTYMQTPGTLGNLPNNTSTSLASLSVDGGNYGFNYYNETLANSNTIQNFYNNKDWWGYSNVAGNSIPVNPNPDPSDIEGTAVYGHGCTSCRAPNFLNKVSGMLEKIIYPTGGNTEFDYESNWYLNGGTTGTPQEGPGIRIASIINDDGSGNKVTRLYKYGPLVNGVENGAGTLLYVPQPNDFRTVKTMAVMETTESVDGGVSYGPTVPSPNFGGYYTISTYTKGPVETLGEAYSLPVYYSTVTEYTQSANGVNNGKTVYEYTTPQPVLGPNGALGAQSFTIKDWTSSKLLNKKTYQYRSLQNDYQMVQWDQTGYTTIAYNKIHQMRFRRFWQLNTDPSYTDRYWDLALAGLEGGGEKTFGFPYDVIDWPIESAAEVPSQQLSTSYVNGVAALTTETDLFYGNPVHLQPTRTETFTSKADEKLITQTSYVQDFSDPGTATAIQQGITNFQNRFIITPVEISRFKSPLAGTPKRLISSQRFTFNPVQPVVDSVLSIDMASPLTDFVPLSITTAGVLTKDGRYSKKIDFDKYDAQSNLVQQHMENGVFQSYIWDYNNLYPIAEVTNADSLSIAYTSFEADGSGNWLIGSTGRNGIGFSGALSYPLSASNTLSKSGLSASTTYVVSYWTTNSSSMTIAGTVAGYPIKGSTINGWTYYEHLVSGQTTITLSGTGNVDEVRLYPNNAQMKTFTYIPLVGVSSIINEKNQIIYYEYDGFQRLMNIKDQYGNVIKHYSYHYHFWY